MLDKSNSHKSSFINPASVSPTPRMLEWAAGFLEGEGSFHFSKYKHLSVSAAQVQKEPLERLQAMFGGSIYGKQPKNPNHSYFWKWSTIGSRAAGICMTLYSLMSPKRKGQIKETLEGWKITRPSRYRKACPHGHLYSGENLLINNGKRYCKACASYYEQVRRGFRKPKWAHRKPGESENFECKRGHLYEESNIYTWRDKRYCMACRKFKRQEWHEKHKKLVGA